MSFITKKVNRCQDKKVILQAASVGPQMDILLLGIIPFGLLYCLLCICNPELHCVLCTGALQGVVGGL